MSLVDCPARTVKVPLLLSRYIPPVLGEAKLTLRVTVAPGAKVEGLAVTVTGETSVPPWQPLQPAATMPPERASATVEPSASESHTPRRASLRSAMYRVL